MSEVFVKRPAEVKDYDVDFSIWLEDGDTIDTATAAIDGGTAVIDQTEFSETSVKVWISGGADGDSAVVTTTVVTANGITKQFAFRLRVSERC